MLFQADSPAWSQSRYYQDAAIRAAFEKLLRDQQAGKPPRVLLTLATGAGKTIIATNLLWRCTRPGSCPSPRCSCATATSCASRPTPSSRPRLR
jgi:type I restriction enzyme R subunit